MPAARERSIRDLSVGTAATQRGRALQFVVMKSNRKRAVVLGSTVAAFSVGAGGIVILDHSETTSAAYRGAVAQPTAASTVAAAARRNQGEVLVIGSSRFRFAANGIARRRRA